MKTEKAKQIYSLRKQTVEPVFGDIKQNKGLTEFLTRSLKTVKTEFNLICIGNNIKKTWIQKQPNKNQQQNKKHSIQKTKTIPKNPLNIFAKLTQINISK